MMQPEVLQPSWPFYSVIDSSLDPGGYCDLDMDIHDDVCEFSSSFTSLDDVSDISSSVPYISSKFSGDRFDQTLTSDVDFQWRDFFLDVEGFDVPAFNEDVMDCVYGTFSESDEGKNFLPQEISSEVEGVWSPSTSIKSKEETSSLETATIPTSSLILPGNDLELDNQLSLLHLLKAYGEAMEKGQGELSEVIMRCIGQKVSPAGESVERLAFSLCLYQEKQVEYIRQESCKNFEAAFRAFYQVFPYGRFAHFAANSAILDNIPVDAESVHIVDFDMGEGVQWPTVIEVLAQQHKAKALRLTAIINWEKEDSDCCSCLMWTFEETKKRLLDHARCFGLKLKIEEMGMEDLANEIKKTTKRGGRKEFLGFNCMVGLPHMGRIRRRKHVEEFLRIAKELMANSVNRSIITFGDGEACENLEGGAGFGLFFHGNVQHYQALLESMESNFPVHLTEARMALESLFVAPFISSDAWSQNWMDRKEGCDLQVGTGLEGLRVSEENLKEAKEMVKQKLSSYGVRIGGHQENEMTLEWGGKSLVRVSTWTNQS